MTDRVFITGASGLVGAAVLGRLARAGRPVVALCRSDDAARTVEGHGAEPVRGDVRDRDALARAMRGCDVVYHVAGLNGFCLRDPSPLFEVNVDGSRNVVEAAARSEVGRVVYTSSAATIGEPAGVVGREETAHRGWFLSHYERSKHEAERVVLAAGARLGVDVVSVNPSSVQGPGRSGGTARLLIDYLNGRLRAIVDTRMSIIDIDDCAEGHLLAEQSGKAGERYLLSGATLTVGEGIALLSRLTGLDERPRKLPPRVAVALAAGVEAVGRIRRTSPPLCREMVRTLCHGHAYDGGRATRELGLRYTPLEQTVGRTVRWFVEEGIVTRPLPLLPA